MHACTVLRDGGVFLNAYPHSGSRVSCWFQLPYFATPSLCRR